ncbi:Ni,Fe-hydrogenase III large subunit [Thioflavicoccus mobilis 8321]|uniref:Ni,Fe-hydrogenase III large subunit n=1 Tax=Thioflavicoccus mobilis 8321 TaxID=765912 RepID=L0H1F5_9GAMM|nr:NADH-quinone oxidoreductase subunit C [Thioflavicoccus mobilis]AGA91887.1 Ni,Fe-hydrogenase III large subunit [Thioflavicoccus mobilis 8321]
MTRFAWLSEFEARLAGEGVRAPEVDTESLAPACRLRLAPPDWGTAAQIAAGLGLRWAGLWGDPQVETGEETLVVQACLVRDGDYLVLATEVSAAKPELASHTPFFAGADRLERHAQDLLGLRFTDHPDPRRWTRHQAWPEDAHPLRPGFAPAERRPRRTPADHDYPFAPLLGAGVVEIPVGPVHAGVIEPGHFRFQVAGEDVLRLEERLGYVHKGIERLAVGRDPQGLARLAARVSGDSTVAHGWAACQALERATGWAVPSRALYLRALLAERERIANHLGDIGAICNDVGFAFALAQCSRLRELWQRRSQALFGHRLLMDRVVPGGVTHDLDQAAAATLRADHAELRRALVPIFEIVEDHPSLDDRLFTTGRLAPADARALGCTGYVGKASGLTFDVRRDSPYPPYDALAVKVPTFTAGDVAARVRVRIGEIRASLELLDRILDQLPGGPIIAATPSNAGAGRAGLGIVDGWRGEILTYVRLDAAGRVARFFPRDPSWFTWPALERLIHGNIVPDFPVCNKSVNGSYAGVDL